ncbi:hypothetical protein ES332_A04G030900v1 [Gossypium tomentosum]|uniref:Uncharacterized protein n=1 Tax=Gossypium tomentosum TaxID=34277 RepID=A0A5D2QUG8_GOSTO|nr:hypothetical protein ES332_A04G030900v1 [Gossypium tomentosum]
MSRSWVSFDFIYIGIFFINFYFIHSFFFEKNPKFPPKVSPQLLSFFFHFLFSNFFFCFCFSFFPFQFSLCCFFLFVSFWLLFNPIASVGWLQSLEVFDYSFLESTLENIQVCKKNSENNNDKTQNLGLSMPYGRVPSCVVGCARQTTM